MHLDRQTLLFTLIVSFLSAMLFGVVPAYRASKADPGEVLNESSRGSSSGLSGRRLRAVLVTGQITLAVALLAGAGVMLRDLVRGLSMPLGFNSHQLAIADLRLDSQQYQTAASRIELFEQVTEKLRSIPGVESAALDNCVPLRCGYGTSFMIVGRQILPDSRKPTARYAVVGPAYFRTMQIPLMKGRDFADSDTSHAPTVAIVSQEFARRYFPKGDAIGQQIEAETLDPKPARIVGIVGNVSNFLGQIRPDSQIYECDLQFPFTAFSSTSILVRSRIASSAIVPILRGAVRSVDRYQPVSGLQTMTDLAATNGGGDKLLVSLLGIFAGLALLLAGIGIYGVTAYSVSQRKREIGIRMALGALPKSVLSLVMRQAGVIIFVGCTAGFLLALPMPRLFSGLFTNFPAQGPFVAVAVTLIGAAVSLVATYIPARRAMKVDPMVALRYE